MSPISYCALLANRMWRSFGVTDGYAVGQDSVDVTFYAMGDMLMTRIEVKC